MKKFVFVLTILCLFSGMAFCRKAREEKPRRFLGIQFALGSGYTFYGDSDLKENIRDARDDSFKRVILYEDFCITLRLTEQFFFLGGIQLMNDYCWSGGSHTNHLSPAFLGGVQIYPGIGNLSFSLCYALGFRKDLDKLPDEYNDIIEAKWGNGFRLGIEYDFKKGGGFVPGVGFAYTFMPTGYKNYDNTLCLYLRFAFR